MKKSVIYKITNPTGKIYIGKTTDFNTRMNSYRCLNNKKQKAIHASILKYGWDAHEVEILEETEPYLLNELEKVYIKKYNSYNRNSPNGLNLTEGGEGSLGRKDSEETKRKRAQKHIGTKRSESTKKLMSDKKKGKIPYSSKLPRTEKQIYHSKYGNLGRKKTEQQLKNELNTKLEKFLKKMGGVLQFDLNYNLIREWYKLPKDVAREIGINDSHLYKALKIKNKNCKNFYWEYKNNSSR
jgi:group I intron endonuclease